jgi:hypothetical protein
MQVGFIGNWGEWWGSCHFPDFECPCSPDDPAWDDRRDVLFAILDTLPSTRMVQLRTPRYKYNIFSNTVICSDCLPQVITPINGSEAYTGIPVARTGHHNDCFVSSPSDCGTYVYTATEYPYLEADTEYLVMGGETGFPSDPDSVRLKCETALDELARFHWSYLNTDWYAPTLEMWKDDGCFTEIQKRLGYRFQLVKSAFADEVKPGEMFTMEVELQNDGWAAPFNPRLVELLIRHKNTGEIFGAALPDDSHFWLADNTATYSLAHAICTPADLPMGEYELLLNLPDPEPLLYWRRKEYSIRLSNKGVWEAQTGYNNLSQTITVTDVATSLPCDSDIVLHRHSKLFLPLILKSWP